ncbi:MAG: S41 family peptidase [Planctomycetota bacterium]
MLLTEIARWTIAAGVATTPTIAFHDTPTETPPPAPLWGAEAPIDAPVESAQAIPERSLAMATADVANEPARVGAEAATMAEKLGWSFEQSRVGFPRMPSISPDGSLIAFSWAGDLWAVPAGGGVASRLTSHPADELRSAFSPDGSVLAFESTRDGSRNLYAMPVSSRDGRVFGGEIRRLTLGDRALTLSGFTADGEALLAHGRLDPAMYRGSSMYRVPLAGGHIQKITDAYGTSPTMSADGSQILFTRRRELTDRPAYRGPGAGDLWSMSTETGRFRQLTTFDGNDQHGFVLPNGSVLYSSSRHGQNNLWLLPSGRTDAAGPRRVTSFEPTDEQLSIGHGVRGLDVSFDGSTAVFCVWDTLYTLDLTQRTPTPSAVSINASVDTDSLDSRTIDLDRQVSEARLSPDGKTLAVIARGEVFVRSTEDDRPTRRVTHTSGRERDLAWSPDNRVLYFASDESGQFAIHQASVALAREDLEPQAVEEAEAEGAAEEQASDEATEDSESTDENAEGDDGQADEAEADDAKDEDEEDAVDHGARWADALRFEVTPVVASDAMEIAPLPSPDGLRLLFVRERGDVWLHDFETGEERMLFESWNQPEIQWASDSRHIVYEVGDLDFNSDIWILDTEDGEPVNVTRHPDIDTSPRLSHDGKVLTFLSDRAGENWSYDVYAVMLDRELEGLTEYELAQYFEDAAKAAKKLGAIDTPDVFLERDADEAADEEATDEEEANDDGADDEAEPMEFDLDDAWNRVRRVTRFSGVGNHQLTPGGERVVFSTSIDGSTSLFSVDYRGRERKTVQSGGVSGVSVSTDGSKVVYLRSGQPTVGKPVGGSSDTMPIDATIRLDVEAEQAQKFRDAARMLGRDFYHPTMKDLDWEGLTNRYLDLARRTRTPSEFYEVANMLFGELNGSHLGIWGGAQVYSPPSIRTGYLGIDYVPVEGGYEVVYVVPEGPASRDASTLHVGDVITAVNGTPLAPDGGMPTVDLREAMAGTSGQETLLDVDCLAEDGSAYVLIVPTSSGGESGLRYEDGVRQRRAMVEEMSGGRLGYLHIRGMNEPALRDFERDLYAAANGREGLLIDVRDNGGGWTTDILLTSLTAPRHAYTIPRGADAEDVHEDAYPRDRRLIYGYNRPIAVLCNENSFSNAEIFSHAIKTTGRGKVIGEQTFGGVISTGSYRLIDGTTVRRPFRGWYLPDGTDMENNGAMPDVRVMQGPSDEAAGRDAQLGSAVRTLLEDMGR